MKKILGIVFSLFLLYACKSGEKKETAAGPANISQLPAQWQHIDSADAVILGKKRYSRNGKDSTDFVIIVNLAAGGGIRVLDSIYKSDSCCPIFHSWSVTDASGTSFWNLFKTDNSFAMTNLQFFNLVTAQTDTARMCYPVFYNGKYISRGCTTGKCESQQKLPQRIITFADTISVNDYHESTCTSQPVPSGAVAAVVGNHPLAARDKDQYVGRTYVAKQGANLILYTSPYAIDIDVYTVLQQEFSIDTNDIVMFDGGGSTQMIARGVTYIPSSDNRRVPCAIEIHSAAKNNR